MSRYALQFGDAFKLTTINLVFTAPKPHLMERQMNILTCSAPSSTRPFIDGNRACVTSSNCSADMAAESFSLPSPIEEDKRDHKHDAAAVRTA